MGQKKWEDRDPDREVVIYCLIDPRDNSKKYVGQSVNFEARFRVHMKAKSQGLKDQWIRELIDVGMKPSTEILENTNYRYASGREKYWIRELRDRGWKLLNLTEGGEEPPLVTPQAIEKIKVTQKEHAILYPEKHDPVKSGAVEASMQSRNDNPERHYNETRNANVSRGNKESWASGNRKPSQIDEEVQKEANRKRSEANRGRVFATKEEYAERGRKTSQTMKEKKERGEFTGGPSKKLSEDDRVEICRRYVNGEKKKPLAREYNVSPKTITNIINESKGV